MAAFARAEAGDERPNSQVPDKSPSTPSGDFHPPRMGQVGVNLSFPGKFDGDASDNQCFPGNQPAELLAEWPRGAVVRMPENAQPGRTMLTVEEVLSEPGRTTPQVARQQFKFNTVSVDLTVDQMHLIPGEGTTLHITLSGLDDYEGLLDLRVEN